MKKFLTVNYLFILVEYFQFKKKYTIKQLFFPRFQFFTPLFTFVTYFKTCSYMYVFLWNMKSADLKKIMGNILDWEDKVNPRREYGSHRLTGHLLSILQNFRSEFVSGTEDCGYLLALMNPPQ